MWCTMSCLVMSRHVLSRSLCLEWSCGEAVVFDRVVNLLVGLYQLAGGLDPFLPLFFFFSLCFAFALV